MTQQLTSRIRRWFKGQMLRHMHGMITCKEFEDFVQSYLDNTIDQKKRKVFEWHLRICRECREYLAAYQRSIELSQAVLGPADAPVPDDVPEDLVKAILDAQRQ